MAKNAWWESAVRYGNICYRFTMQILPVYQDSARHRYLSIGLVLSFLTYGNLTIDNSAIHVSTHLLAI